MKKYDHLKLPLFKAEIERQKCGGGGGFKLPDGRNKSQFSLQAQQKTDYKAMFDFNRYKIDNKIENFDLTTDLAMNIFSSVWGGLFRNKKIEYGMIVRCNQCFTRLYFEDVVRFISTIKNSSSAYTPILRNYFLFLLDYGERENIFFSGKVNFFNFAILNKIWFAEKWINYLKREQQFSIIMNNHKCDVLPEAKKIKQKIKTKHTIQTKKTASFNTITNKKFFDDNYLIVSTLLKRLNIDVETLSETIKYSVEQIVGFMCGQKNVFLNDKLISLFYINRINKGLTLLELTGCKKSELCEKFYYVKIEELIDIITKMYCVEYCDNMNQTAMFNFHKKRLGKTGNKKVFENLVLYFLWLNEGYSNDIRKLIVNYWNSIIREWKRPFSFFKERFLLLDSFGFNWEKSIFLSRSAGSYFIDKNFSKSFVVGDRIIVNPQVGKIPLKKIKNENKNKIVFFPNTIKIEKSEHFEDQKKPEEIYCLYSRKELDNFKKMTKDQLKKIMDDQSEVFTNNPEIDQKRFDQILEIFEKI